MMIKTYKYKIKPKKAQSERLEQWLGVTRLIYNTALSVKIDAYQKLGKTVTRFDLQKELPEINRVAGRKEFEWVKDVNAQSLQCVLKRLDNTYQNFFRGGAGCRPGFPKFAKKDKWKSIEFPQNVIVENSRIWLPKLGYVNYHKSRDLDGIIKTTMVTKEIDGWYINLSCECERTLLSSSDNQVGLDVGVAHFFVSARRPGSDGQLVENPRWLNNYSRDLRIIHRRIARRKKGSSNRRKAVGQLQKKWSKIKRCRKNKLHELSTEIVLNNDLIAVENLKLRNMTRSAKGTVENPGKNVKQKSGLNRSMLDLGVGSFFSMLEYKAEYYGRNFVKVDPKYTSQTCHQCNHRSKENRKTQSQFACVKCGHTANADYNAACNILQAGRTVLLSANVSRKLSGVRAARIC